MTPSETLLTVFADVLHAWSRNPRFTLNVTLFHRLPLHPQVDEIIGDFTGINLLEIDHAQPGSFVERGKRIQQQLWQDLDHRYFSGIRVLRAMARQRESSGGALMPVVFTSALALGAGSDGTFGQAVYGISQTSQVWLDHQVMEQAGALHFNWDTVEELFPVGLLDDMFTSYCACLERLALDETSLDYSYACFAAADASRATRRHQCHSRAGIEGTAAYPISPTGRGAGRGRRRHHAGIAR